MPRQFVIRELLPEEHAGLAEMRVDPRLNMRAEIVLAAAEGQHGRHIAAALGLSPQRVYYWLHRFNDHGLEGLRYRTSGGRPSWQPGPLIKEILLAILSDPQQLNLRMDRWTISGLKEYLNQKGLDVSTRQVETILRTLQVGKRARIWQVLHEVLAERLDALLAVRGAPPEANVPSPRPPRVLVIDDMAADLLYAKELFQAGGFRVETAPSLRQGWRKARELLAPGKSESPTLILLDMMLPDQSQRSGEKVDLEGFLLAADLIKKMEQGDLSQAPIVAYSNDMTEARRHNALDAGCHAALSKPLQQSDIEHLYALAMQPSAVRTVRPSLAAASSQALHILHRHASEVVWDAQAVDDLLFDPFRLFDSPEGRTWQLWIEQRGGLDEVYRWIDGLVFPDPIHRKLLNAIRTRQEASAWKHHLSDVGIGRNMYYKKRRELFSLIASELNGWSYEKQGINAE